MMRSTSAVLPFVVAVMSTLFKSINAFKVPLRYGHRSSAATIRLHLTAHASSSLLARHAISYMNTRSNGFSATQVFSTSADVNLPTSTYNKESAPNALHTVMVHRNKQSMAFREGTPLVFTKSIAATYSEMLDDSAGEFDGEYMKIQ